MKSGAISSVPSAASAGPCAATRDSTLERRLKKFDELRARTNLMAGALSFRTDALLEKLIALEGDVKLRLFGGQSTLVAPPIERPQDEAEILDTDVGFWRAVRRVE